VLDRGQQRYEAYCAMCHGLTGEGNGMIVRRGYRKPPSYHEDRLQEGQTPAAHFFDVITNGWGAMPSYDYLVPAEDRWKIIAYIRALQLSRRENFNDLSPEQQEKVRSGQQGQHGAEGHAGGEPAHGGERQ
ncbi:MAG: cytochrome c, partial [Pyrinomonadaceae bacterium]